MKIDRFDSFRGACLGLGVFMMVCSIANAESNGTSFDECDIKKTHKEAIECACNKAGGLYFEHTNSTKFGCRIGDDVFVCDLILGAFLNCYIVTDPSVNPADPGGVSGALPLGPGGEDAVETESDDSSSVLSGILVSDSPLANNVAVETEEAADAQESSADIEAFSSRISELSIKFNENNSPIDQNLSGAANASGGEQTTNQPIDNDSTDESPESDKPVDAPAYAASQGFASADADTNSDEPLAAFESQPAGVCGAGAMAAIPMLIAGLSLIGGRRKSVEQLSLIVIATLLTFGSSASAKNNDEFGTTCDAQTLSPKDFVECLCDNEGGIFWETDTEFGCWQLEPGEFDYRCLKGQPLSSCIVTLPAVDPPDEKPEKRPNTGAVSGGPGGGDAVSVDPNDTSPSAPDFDTLDKSDTPPFFAGLGTPASGNKTDQFRSLNENTADANDDAEIKQFESEDEQPANDPTNDDSAEIGDSNVEPEATVDSDVAAQRAMINAQASGPCGAGAMAAVAMTIAGLSLIGGRRRRI